MGTFGANYGANFAKAVSNAFGRGRKKQEEITKPYIPKVITIQCKVKGKIRHQTRVPVKSKVSHTIRLPARSKIRHQLSVRVQSLLSRAKWNNFIEYLTLLPLTKGGKDEQGDFDVDFTDWAWNYNKNRYEKIVLDMVTMDLKTVIWKGEEDG
jgi:hypothetical protein